MSFASRPHIASQFQPTQSFRVVNSPVHGEEAIQRRPSSIKSYLRNADSAPQQHARNLPLERKPSLRLMPLINRFEALDSSSFEPLATSEVRASSPLQVLRQRPRIDAQPKSQLSNIVGPDAHRFEDVFTEDWKRRVSTTDTVISTEVGYADDDSAAESRKESQDVVLSCEGARLLSNPETEQMNTFGNLPDERGDARRSQSLSVKDKIKLFDQAQNAVAIKKVDSPAVKLLTKKQILPSPDSKQRSIEKIGLAPPLPITTPTKPSFRLHEPILDTPTKRPFREATPQLPIPKAPLTTTSNFPSPPKVKLSNVYTSNNHLPARGRAILRHKDMHITEPRLGRQLWSPPKMITNNQSPFKERGGGHSTVPVDSDRSAIHNTQWDLNLSDKVEAIYSTPAQGNGPSQISNNDGKDSRQSSRDGYDRTRLLLTRPAGKIGSRIAALKRLFDGNSRETESSTYRMPMPTTPSTPQKVASGSLYTTSMAQTAMLGSSPRRTQPIAKPPEPGFQRIPTAVKPKARGKIGDKIKLFESIAKGREILGRPFRGSTSSTRKIRGSHSSANPFRRSSRTVSYSELNDITEEFNETGGFNGKREMEGKRRSLAGLWNDIKPAGANGGSSRRTDEADGEKQDRARDPEVDIEVDAGLLFVKQARCNIREPKPVRLVEMKRMVALCKDFVGSGNVSGSANGGAYKENFGREVRS
ncbi:hypothetical protein BP6252_03260 [Coleophoma cylindrospora]|uniref:Uncharacterized protein n=1 Tax=Coleophoma cylindrospora TaxID=1849047 RepID=A0A3D8S788_9HELO|nr:hypothetical protein BP6252_03260 [Coleophoma cylindrospora]